jgi:hypothetical protein
MKNLINVVIGCIFLCFTLSSCSQDECLEYSKYTCKQLEQATYNVLFYFPNNDKEYYLGESIGLSSCEDIANSYADEKNLTSNSEWSYLCCLKTKDSECEEKHK